MANGQSSPSFRAWSGLAPRSQAGEGLGRGAVISLEQVGGSPAANHFLLFVQKKVIKENSTPLPLKLKAQQRGCRADERSVIRRKKLTIKSHTAQYAGYCTLRAIRFKGNHSGMFTIKTKLSLRKTSFLLIVAAFLWAVIIEPRWVAKREIALNLTKTSELKGLKVVLTSDWHLTKRPLWRVMTTERAREIVNEINAAKPDIIILAGDFIADQDYKPELADTAEEEIATVLGELKAKYGVYATLGNHDWWFNGEAFTQALQQHGITVLENNSIKINGLNLWLAGIGDSLTNHAKPDLAVKYIPQNEPAIITMHDPGALKLVSNSWQNDNALFLAGHTHGGQIYLPFYGALVVPGMAPREWAYGWVQHNQHNMYVTSGLGVSILPVRFNMRPEWVEFTLY